MADAAWSFSDLSGIAGAGAFLMTIAGYLHLNGKQSKNVDVIGEKADRAHAKAEAVATDLAAYKVTAVEKFVPREHLDQMKAEIIQRIDKQDERLSQSFGQVTERLDRIIEGRPKA